MRNICNVDITKTPYELGYTNESKCNNEISLTFKVDGIINPYLEITLPTGGTLNTEILAIDNEEITYTLPISYYLISGTLKVRVRSTGFDSDYITFNIPTSLSSSNDIIVKIENDEYVVKKINVYKYTDIPIATKNTLGGIIVGDNLEIDSNGVLSATGGGGSGTATTISVGETTTGEAGTNASVTNVGTSTNAVFNFVIPRGKDGTNGVDGVDGEDGKSATIQIGTVTTLEAGSNATIENVGTETDAIFNFGIPKGKDGSDAKDNLEEITNDEIDTIWDSVITEAKGSLKEFTNDEIDTIWDSVSS